MSLDFRIEKRDPIRVVGISVNTTMENNICMKEIPSLWGEVIGNGKHLELLNIMNQEPLGLIGISVYNIDDRDPNKFKYLIASATDKKAPEGMTEYIVPEATWAVFPCKRTEIAEVEVEIVNEWQLTSGYEVVNLGYNTGKIKSEKPDMEVHGQDDYAEVWIAVKES